MYVYIYIYIHAYSMYIYMFLYSCVHSIVFMIYGGASCRCPLFPGRRRRRGTRVFRDVVLQDVGFEHNSCVTLLSIVCYCNIYAKSIIIKLHILKHHILELPIIGCSGMWCFTMWGCGTFGAFWKDLSLGNSSMRIGWTTIWVFRNVIFQDVGLEHNRFKPHRPYQL